MSHKHSTDPAQRCLLGSTPAWFYRIIILSGHYH